MELWKNALFQYFIMNYSFSRMNEDNLSKECLFNWRSPNGFWVISVQNHLGPGDY